MPKKGNFIWAKIGVIAGALFTIILVLGKVLGFFEQGVKMREDIKSIPKLEARIDTVEVKVQVQKKVVQRVDEKMDLLLNKWDIPIPPDTG